MDEIINYDFKKDKPFYSSIIDLLEEMELRDISKSIGNNVLILTHKPEHYIQFLKSCSDSSLSARLCNIKQQNGLLSPDLHVWNIGFLDLEDKIIEQGLMFEMRSERGKNLAGKCIEPFLVKYSNQAYKSYRWNDRLLGYRFDYL